MKTLSFSGLAALALVCLLVPRANAIAYYDFVQPGYVDSANPSGFTGTLRGEIRITDVTHDGITADDTLYGSFVYTRLIGNGSTYVRGFNLTSISGASITNGLFTISMIAGNPNLGGGIVTEHGGSITNYVFPFTGVFTTAVSTQAPRVTERVADRGTTAALLGVSILGLFAAGRKMSSL